MTRVTVKRRPDGIVQIQRRPAWRAITGTVPAAVLGALVLALLAMGGLAAMLVLHPMLVLLGGGLAALALAGARYAFHDGQGVRHAQASRPRRGPPQDAA